MSLVMENTKYVSYHPEIPSPPQEILDEILAIVNEDNNTFCFSDYQNFRIYQVNEKIDAWIDLQPQFQGLRRQKIQTIESELPTHIDMDRTYVYNFLLDAGGDEVHTKFFDTLEETNVIEDHVLPAGMWHRLEVTVPHGVFNVAPGKKRIAISIGDKAKLNRAAYRHQRGITGYGPKT